MLPQFFIFNETLIILYPSSLHLNLQLYLKNTQMLIFVVQQTYYNKNRNNS